MPCDPKYTTIEGSAKLVFSAISRLFSWVITHDFESQEDFDALRPPVHNSRGIGKTRDFGHFWPFLCVIAHDFRPREDFDAL